MKYAATAIKKHEKDIEEGFCSQDYDFPPFWPCVVDSAFNIVAGCHRSAMGAASWQPNRRAGSASSLPALQI